MSDDGCGWHGGWHRSFRTRRCGGLVARHGVPAVPWAVRRLGIAAAFVGLAAAMGDAATAEPEAARPAVAVVVAAPPVVRVHRGLRFETRVAMVTSGPGYAFDVEIEVRNPGRTAREVRCRALSFVVDRRIQRGDRFESAGFSAELWPEGADCTPSPVRLLPGRRLVLRRVVADAPATRMIDGETVRFSIQELPVDGSGRHFDLAVFHAVAPDGSVPARLRLDRAPHRSRGRGR